MMTFYTSNDECLRNNQGWTNFFLGLWLFVKLQKGTERKQALKTKVHVLDISLTAFIFNVFPSKLYAMNML